MVRSLLVIMVFWNETTSSPLKSYRRAYQQHGQSVIRSSQPRCCRTKLLSSVRRELKMDELGRTRISIVWHTADYSLLFVYKSVSSYNDDVTGENQCIVTINDTRYLRQCGDNFMDKEACLRIGGCYRHDRPPFCYCSIGKRNYTNTNLSINIIITAFNCRLVFSSARVTR